ncbi:hypothetical protein GALL_519480 [mine drainage metagenome]|uniref:Uncharacterized protein n=1 Tax=mine drainage metagenome TaxID=410659 RepID=A0A1J5P6T3_9ZZZZ
MLAHAEPFLDLVGHLGLQLAVLCPFLQKGDTARVRKFEEKMLRTFELWPGTRQGRVRVDQVSGGVDCTTTFAVVTVLIPGVALGAFAFDEAVGQEHVFCRVKKLFNGARLDQRALCVVTQVKVNLACQFMVFRGIGAVPVVKADVKTVQIGLAPGGNSGDKLLCSETGFFSGNHDRCAMRVICTAEVHGVAHHALVAHPDIGLDVLHDVANMEMTIGIGQGGGNEELTRHGA